MKILRVCYEYPPPWDGLTPGPYEISRAQAKAGHKILFLAGGRSKDPFAGIDGVRVARSGKVWPTYFSGPFFSFDLKLIFHIWKILKNDPPDVIHFHGNTALWFNISRLLGFFRSVPYVFHAHSSGLGNFQVFWRKAAGFMRIKALFIWPLLILQDFITVRTADGIIAVCENDREIFIKNYRCPDEKISVIENGVNTMMFVRDARPSHHGLKIIMAAYLQPRKNLEKLLAVVKALARQGASPQLTIVGRGESRYISKLKALSKVLGVEDSVIWKGYVAYPELSRIYAEHDLLLLLSYSEGLPKVILEALSCGLRVVTTRSFSVTGFLNDCVTWVNERDDAEHIAGEVLRSMDKAIDFDRFRREYSWDKKAEEIDRVYAKATAKRFKHHAGLGS